MSFDHALDFPATPFIGTRVRIDTPEVVLLEPPSGESRAGDRIKGADPKKDVEFFAGTGWRLRAYQSSSGDAGERQAAQAGILRPQSDGGTLQASSYLQKHAAYRQRPDTQATYGAGNATAGDDHYSLEIPASVYQSQGLKAADMSADRAAFPGPDDDPASVGSIRLLVDSQPHAPGTPVHFKITVPDPIVGSHKELGKVYFSGPASQRTTTDGKSVQGYGSYCARIYGDGLATMYELTRLPTGTKAWRVMQAEIRWCPPSQVAGTAHHLEIVTEEFASPRTNKTGFIILRSSDVGSAHDSFSGGLLRIAATTGPTTGFTKLYAHCDDPKLWIAATHAPIRYDHRADASPTIQVSKPVYPATGYFVVEPFDTCVIPGYPNAVFTAYWLGTVPTGCSVSISVYAEDQDPLTGTALSPISTNASAYGGNARFNLAAAGDGVNAHRSYRVKITLNGDGSSTPTVSEVGTFKDGSGVVYDVGETIVDHPAAEYQASGQDFETGREAMMLTLRDQFGQATALAFRSQMPLRIDVPYPDDGERDVTPTSKRSVLFRGYVAAATSEKIHRVDIAQGIDANARTYTCQLVGMHQRLDEAVAPVYYSFLLDRNVKSQTGAEIPALVSDVIREILGWCGFGDSEIGWTVGDPRYPLRLFPSRRDADVTSINATSPLGEIAMRLARDYLGKHLAFCPNSSATAPAEGADPTGCWIMVDPPKRPYKPLARFEGSPLPSSESGIYLAHSPWPDWQYGGRAVPVRPILRGETKRPEAPEFNFLIVSGVTDVGSAAGYKRKLTTIVPNLTSFDAIPGVEQVDQSSVDYVGRPRRLIYVDQTLSTPDAVQFAARRLMDYAGRGRIYRGITAPLVLVSDPDDPYIRRKRPLRPNDCIVVRGKVCVVRSCALFAKRDGFQMQRIEAFELPPDPDNPIG